MQLEREAREGGRGLWASQTATEADRRSLWRALSICAAIVAMEGPPDRRMYPVAPSVLAVVVAAAGIAFGISLLDLDDPWAHAAGHAVGLAVAATLLILALRFWPLPFPHWINRRARSLLVVGLAIGALGQGLEMVGAFGYDGDAETSGLSSVHNVGVYLGAGGVLLTMLSALSSVVAGGAARWGMLDSPWFKVALGAAVVLVALFVGGSFIFGY